MSIKTLILALALASGLAGAGFAKTTSDADPPTTAVAPMTNLPSDQSLISGYYKAKVYDQGHYKVGEIKDMLFDQNGTITAVLLSEPPRVCWRPFRSSHAAMAEASVCA